MLLSNLYFLRSIVLSNFKRLDFPFKCSFAITYKCNSRCRMCAIWKKPHDRPEVTVGDIEHFFKRAQKFSWVGLTGGEPFMRYDLIDIINIIIKYSKYLCVLHFASNGYLTEKIINIVKHIRKNHNRVKLVFTISIDGPPNIHNETRGVCDAWTRAVDTFIQLKQFSPVKSQIGFTISKYNVDTFSDTFTALKREYPPLGFNDINVNIFQKSDFYYDNQEMANVDKDHVCDQINKIITMSKGRLSINNFLRTTYLKLYPQFRECGKSPLTCQAFSSTLFIDPYGNLFPCAVFNRKLINIKEMTCTLARLWRSDMAKHIRYQCSHNMCPVCWSPCDAFSSISGSLLKAIKHYVSYPV